MNKEIIETIKNVKTSDELKEVAIKNGYNLTDTEAKGYFDLYHNNGKVNEEELDNVTGGSSCIGGRTYSDDPHGYLIVTLINGCNSFLKKNTAKTSGSACAICVHCTSSGPVLYCENRTRWDDPYNDKIGTKRKPGPDEKYSPITNQ